jgi:DnaJ-domain-containing protein 1
MLSREYVVEREAVTVEVTLADGTLVKGRLWVPAAKKLSDTLNGSQTFLEFTPFGEERSHFLAKAHITTIKVIEVPKAVPLYERRGAAGADDPHQILAVPTGASWSCVREAYLGLVKTYHPDRFSSMDLPNEVLEYLNAKARRINAAYALLEDSFKRAAMSVAG